MEDQSHIIFSHSPVTQGGQFFAVTPSRVLRFWQARTLSSADSRWSLRNAGPRFPGLLSSWDLGKSAALGGGKLQTLTLERWGPKTWKQERGDSLTCPGLTLAHPQSWGPGCTPALPPLSRPHPTPKPAPPPAPGSPPPGEEGCLLLPCSAPLSSLPPARCQQSPFLLHGPIAQPGCLTSRESHLVTVPTSGLHLFPCCLPRAAQACSATHP